uniref:C-type lectin n=1 Tax=Sinohyriopsis schlegelii TaxID=2706150 RepID=A0A2S0XA62_SINSH|nr:C-type lectin [Sinohyriopsis schlegelii]
MMFNNIFIVRMLFHVMLMYVAYASDNTQNDCTENTKKCQVDGPACRNVYQFFGDSSCPPDFKKYIDDAIYAVFTRQNKSVGTSDESIKALTAKIDALDKKIDTISITSITKCPSGYEYYHPDKFWYKFHSECKSWSDARQVCQDEGGDLISLTEKNFDFFRLVSRSRAGECINVWVGTRDISSEGQWYWVNGERVSSSLWQPGQPDNTNNNEHCGDLRKQFQYRLNDYVCSIKQHFLCQFF